MYPRLIAIAAALLSFPGLSGAQTSGNVGFSGQGGKARAENRERSKRVLAREELPPSASSTYVDANVLINVPANQYVAVFGIVQEGKTAAECGQKMNAAIADFSRELKAIGIGADSVSVDFIAQNRIYGFEVAGDVAREKLVGLELKKNVSIAYKDKSLLDKIVLVASQLQIFDLIKVDYIVTNATEVQDRLLDEAGRIIKKKVQRYELLLDIKLRAPAQVIAARPSTYFPTEMYDSYTAYEAEQVDNPANRRAALATQSARKSRTFFYNALDADGFDLVINPVVSEPVVQFTLFLKVKYEVAPPSAK